MTTPADGWRDVTALCAPGEETVTRLELIEDGVDVAEVYPSMLVEPGTIILINTALITEEFRRITGMPVEFGPPGPLPQRHRTRPPESTPPAAG